MFDLGSRPTAIRGIGALIVATSILACQPLAEPRVGRDPGPSASPVERVAEIAPPSAPAIAASSVPGWKRVERSSRDTVGGLTYTTAQFDPEVTFQLPSREGWAGPSATNWCSTVSTDRTVLLTLTYGCVNELRIISPTSVRCGTPTDHPNAEELANAILAHPTLKAIEIDPISGPGGIKPTFLAPGLDATLLRLDPAAAFDADAVDPDGCTIVGGAIDPVVEIRADTSQLVMLLDVRDQLIVIRASAGGYDGPSTAAARSRGYMGDNLRYLFDGVRDVRFR